MPRTDRRLMEGAYESIKARIISLDLPPGGRLDDRALSLELGLSRTPVREAAFRLVAEGFVDLGAGSSFVVHPIDLLEMPRLPPEVVRSRPAPVPHEEDGRKGRRQI